MNRLIIESPKGNSVFLDDLDIKFPDDIKLGSYSITAPNTPELSRVFTSGPVDAILNSTLSGYAFGKVVITSKTPDSINFNFIRTDEGDIFEVEKEGESGIHITLVPTIDSGLSAFQDTKVSTIGAYKAYDFTSDAQGELTWRNIYGLKTSPREEPVEKLPTDHTAVWGDVDPVTACNPFGSACTENYAFRYDNVYMFGGQNRLMTNKLIKFTCLETGFYVMNVGNIDIEVDNHASNFIDGTRVLNINEYMWTTPSIDCAVIEDDKFDDLKGDFILYPKQESYISINQDATIGGEANEVFQRHLDNSPTYPTDSTLIGTPYGYAVGVESDIFSFSKVTYGESTIDGANTNTGFSTFSNKDGVVAAHRLVWSGYFTTLPNSTKRMGIFPCDVRGMLCTGVKDRRLKMVPLYDGSLCNTYSSHAPTLEEVRPFVQRYKIYFGNRVVVLSSDFLISDPVADTTNFSFSPNANKMTVSTRIKGQLGPIFLEAGKTYSFVVQVSSCPIMVTHNGRKELRYMFPKEIRANYDKISDELTFDRSIQAKEKFISPSPHDTIVGKISELSVVDTLDGSFWEKEKAGTPVFNTISLNPKGDYYDFARGLRGDVENSGLNIRHYNKLLLDKILSTDFKVTVSSFLDRFSLGVRDVDGVYHDLMVQDFISEYDGVDYTVLYSGGFDYAGEVSHVINVASSIVKSKMEFAIRNTTEGEDDNTIDNAFEDTHTLTFSRNSTPQYHYDFLSLNHDTAKEINNYIEVTDFPCQFQVGETWITTCSSNIVDVLNIDTIKETCTVRFYLPTAGYLL